MTLFTKHWSKISSKTLSSLPLPGTHDSCAFKFLPTNPIANISQFPNLNYKWLFKLVPGVFTCVSNSSEAQTLSIPDQLSLGIKFLDLRVASSNNILTMNHTFPCADPSMSGTALTLKTVLSYVADYLAKNPFEFLVVMIDINDPQVTTEVNTLLSQYLMKSDEFLSGVLSDLQKSNHRLAVINDLFISPSIYSDTWVNTSDPTIKTTALISQYNEIPICKLYKLNWTLTPQTADVQKYFYNYYSCGVVGNSNSLLNMEAKSGFDISGLSKFLQANPTLSKSQVILVDGADTDFIILIDALWSQ